MTHAATIIYDDAHGSWGPMTDLRPVFDTLTGTSTLRQRIERVLNVRADALAVPTALQPLVAHTANIPVNDTSSLAHDSALAINGRWTALRHVEQARSLAPGHALAQSDGQIIAAHLSRSDVAAFVNTYKLPHATQVTKLADDKSLLTRPWQILDHLDDMLRADLAATPLPPLREDPSIATIGRFPVCVAPNAKLHPRITINTEKGPVVIDEQAIIGSFTVIAGPCYIGRGTVIAPFTHVRANMVIGPKCVIGGEVSYSVIQGHTNKCHAGYLGNSLVGEWVNLGADTTVSNLKNTYTNVRMQLDAADNKGEDSGRDKLGPLIGDHVRTAIGSRIMTGSCLLTGTMLALSGFAPKFTDRFSFHTDDGLDRYEMDKFIASTRKAMSRRQCDLTAAQIQRLHDLFQM